MIYMIILILLNKKIKKLSKIEKRVIKNKSDKKYYYENVDKIKKEYKNIIDESNPITVMLFIKDGIKKISESN